MRYKRLKVCNYRGIEELEVSFAESGTTLIQGPNETGKTSLSEAIGVLFEYYDNSKHRAVEAIKPVDRDVSPEIELEAESGPYAFTYSKRFYKKAATSLTVTSPKPESLTGREAHERALEILRETLDMSLWKALNVQQGDAIRLPELSGQTWLSMALDRAAGGHSADPREEDLFNRVHEEYNKYFTDLGAEKKDLSDCRSKHGKAKSAVENIRQQLQELEHEIDQAASLKQELVDLRSREEELASLNEEYEALLEEIGTLDSALAGARLRLADARAAESTARGDLLARQELVEAVAQLEKAHQEALGLCGESQASLTAAETELAGAQTRYEAAERSRKAASNLAEIRRSDYDYFNNKLALEQLRERKTRIDNARRDIAAAKELLERNLVSEEALDRVQSAERELLIAVSRLETGAPNVAVLGLADATVVIDGKETALGKGQESRFAVPDRSTVVVPGVVEIWIEAGSSTETLSRKVEEASHALKEACEEAGVESPEQARKAAEEKRAALRTIEEKGNVERENLRDLTYEQLSDKLMRLERSDSEYLLGRAGEPPISAGLDEAKKERELAEAALREAESAYEEARNRLDTAQGVKGDLGTEFVRVQERLKILENDLGQKKTSLDEARERATDDALQQVFDEAVEALSAEEESVDGAQQALDEKDPEGTRAKAEAACDSLQTARNRISDVNTELAGLQASLKVRGEKGLQEKLDLALTELERAEYESRALLRRAAAAKCLFETMKEERDRARKAYVAPLKERVQRLGRLVYGTGFEVDIDDDLQIVSRTEDGVTVPFGYLSGGTREQLSLIFRLACSMIVAQDGGTPVILDDTLGYSDPARLRLMGVVLAQAAKECQIVIFTCTPGRYSHIGQASVVSIGC